MIPSSPLLLRALVLATVLVGAGPFGESTPLDALSDSFWTYVTMGLSVIVTEELTPIFGGIAVRVDELRGHRVIIALTLGSWLATTLLYWLGRAKWDMLRRRFPKLRAAGTVALRVVQRNPWRASLLVRFAFGARIFLPVACGAARVSLPVYLVASLLGALAWTLVFTMVGYAAGEAAIQVMGHIGRAGEIIGAVVLTAIILAAITWQRKRAERKAHRRQRTLR